MQSTHSKQRDRLAASLPDKSRIGERKRAFQAENRRQMSAGLLPADEAALISREAARGAAFKFKT
ncbi:hypothetical protein [Noviherbaspirillum sp. Root189]|uniref:hypothetical protein n=1 Tax=Noviherbaspirillum sp. Root189 TaxID=1736487 RepID=UPI00070F4EE2|nr:hypothetical protein [Noviherbaspirillum sp. Root189]